MTRAPPLSSAPPPLMPGSAASDGDEVAPWPSEAAAAEEGTPPFLSHGASAVAHSSDSNGPSFFNAPLRVRAPSRTFESLSRACRTDDRVDDDDDDEGRRRSSRAIITEEEDVPAMNRGALYGARGESAGREALAEDRARAMARLRAGGWAHRRRMQAARDVRATTRAMREHVAREARAALGEALDPSVVRRKAEDPDVHFGWSDGDAARSAAATGRASGRPRVDDGRRRRPWSEGGSKPPEGGGANPRRRGDDDDDDDEKGPHPRLFPKTQTVRELLAPHVPWKGAKKKRPVGSSTALPRRPATAAGDASGARTGQSDWPRSNGPLSGRAEWVGSVNGRSTVEGQRPGTGHAGPRQMYIKDVSRTLEVSAEELRRVHDEFRAMRAARDVELEMRTVGLLQTSVTQSSPPKPNRPPVRCHVSPLDHTDPRRGSPTPR